MNITATTNWATPTSPEDFIIQNAAAHLSPIKKFNNDNANDNYSNYTSTGRRGNFISIAQKSVLSANEILIGIEHDLHSANEVIRKRNEHTNNLEELIWLLKKENHELKV